jgi:hypothetical protein
VVEEEKKKKGFFSKKKDSLRLGVPGIRLSKSSEDLRSIEHEFEILIL